MAESNTTAAAPAEPTFNVFFGNLPFNANEETLKGFFPDQPDLVSVKVIRRGGRSLGYGFVDFKSETAAKSAVEAWNKKSLGEREINVELARPPQPKDANATATPATRGARRGRARRGRGAGRGAGRGPRSEGSAEASTTGGDAAASTSTEEKATNRRRGGRRGGRGGRRGGRGGRGDAAAAAAPATEGASTEGASSSAPARRGRGRGPRRGGRRTTSQSGEEKPAVPKVESKTSLFVANLPFSVTDETLKNEVFAGHPVTKAYVVVIKRTGRSKGFGFVEFATEAEANNALSVNDKVVSDRPISVKKALVPEAAPATA